MDNVTFAMIKSRPCGISGMVPMILHRIVNSDLVPIMLETRFLRYTEICELYKDHIHNPYWKDLLDSVDSRVVVMVLKGNDNIPAWKHWRNLMGPHGSASHGTIRHWYYQTVTQLNAADNAVHGSDSEESATRELELFFPRRGAIYG